MDTLRAQADAAIEQNRKARIERANTCADALSSASRDDLVKILLAMEGMALGDLMRATLDTLTTK